MNLIRALLTNFQISVIKLYQKTLSLDHGFLGQLTGQKVCRFHPTCSDYAIEAIKKYGPIKGLWLAVKRVARCNPWNQGGYDPLK